MPKKKPDTLELPPVEAELPQPMRKSRESFFGGLLLLLFGLFLLLAVLGAGYAGYRLWHNDKVADQAPSITALQDLELADTPVIAPDPALPVTAPAPASADPEVQKKAQETDVAVMNGGGAKGVAGQAAVELRNAGFTKVTVGNTTGDFKGTTLYHAAGLEKEAAAVQEKLAAKYPNISLKPAEAANKETASKPLVLIFGS